MEEQQASDGVVSSGASSEPGPKCKAGSFFFALTLVNDLLESRRENERACLWRAAHLRQQRETRGSSASNRSGLILAPAPSSTRRSHLTGTARANDHHYAVIISSSVLPLLSVRVPVIGKRAVFNLVLLKGITNAGTGSGRGTRNRFRLYPSAGSKNLGCGFRSWAVVGQRL